MRFIKGFGQFWYDFIIGDDWKIAAAVVLVLAAGGVAVVAGAAHSPLLILLLVVGLGAAFTAALLIDTRFVLASMMFTATWSRRCTLAVYRFVG